MKLLVREAVREKIETLRDAVRHESAKHPTMQDLRTLKHFQAELERYEVAYQKCSMWGVRWWLLY